MYNAQRKTHAMTTKNIHGNAMLTRRAFFGGTIAATAFAGCRGLGGGKASKGATKDPNLSVFFSDIHISGPNVKSKWGSQPTYQNPLLGKAVDAVLAMDPLPARVVVFGDIALWFGLVADYETSQPILKRITDAGIDLYVTTGNHDHREPMFRFYPKQAEITPVKGRFVSAIDLGYADLFLMDSLKENLDGEGAGNAVDGELDDAQQKWLVSAASAAKRPFFVGAHHPPNEVKVGSDRITAAFEKNPMFAGYIYGHNHRWFKQWHHKGYSRSHVIRSVCIPSTGWWGDIGYATMRTHADRAELSLVETDFFFPKPLAKGEKRPREWDEILSENRGDVCTFTY